MLQFLFLDPINSLVFAPVIEPADTTDAVITTSTYECLRLGYFNRVPLLMGHNSFEAVSMEYSKLNKYKIKLVVHYDRRIIILYFVVVIKQWCFYLLQSDIFPSLLVPDSMNANAIGKLLAGPQIKFHYADILGSIIFPDENFLRVSTRYLSKI